jgi:hypothetical protein
MRARNSIGGPDRPNEGIAAAPLIRFLEVAGTLAGIELPRTPDTRSMWRCATSRLIGQPDHGADTNAKLARDPPNTHAFRPHCTNARGF